MDNREYRLIGKPIPRVDGPVKTRGEAPYTTDITLPGMLQGKILRSPCAHARILRIDTSKAERLKGVKAVITGRDIPRIRYGNLILLDPDAGDRYLLAQDRVRFVGDEVAAVAAINEEIAEEALKRIEVEYEELPGVFSIAEATRQGAPAVHEECPGNIHAQKVMDFGDVEQGFGEADYIREDRFTTQLVGHCCLEPHVSVADFDSAGKLTLWTSTQAPFLKKILLSKVADIPLARLKLIKPCMGGGFGGKTGVYPLDLCSVLLAKKTGKPVRICDTREEEFAATQTRHPLEICLKIGVKRDGTILSRTATIMMDGGAYNNSGMAGVHLALFFLTIIYRQPNIKLEAYRVYTNKSPCGAMRGYTAPQVHLASELQMDRVAEELGIDPLELRIRNGLRSGDVTANGLSFEGGSLAESLKRLGEVSEWKKKFKGLPPLKGIGVGCSGFYSGLSWPVLGPATATSTILMKANADGTIMIISGVSDIGQGSDTMLCQITAEELGIEMEDVMITVPDTDLCPPDAMSVGQVTSVAGNAARRAVLDLKEKLFTAVAGKLEANVEDLEAGGRRIYVKGSPEIGFSFVEAVALAQMAQQGMAVVGEGSYDSSVEEGKHSPAYKFTTATAEVTVDRETGRIEIEKVTMIDDCGQIINLLGVEGQLEGGVSMGLGYALYENMTVEGGKILNPGFLDYKLPTSLEMPEVASIFSNWRDPMGPYGAKEGAEGMVGPVAPAILNALYDATGIRFAELPVTAENLLRALRQKEG